MKNNNYLYLVFAVTGYIFLKSGFEKISGGKFIDSLSVTLMKFSKDNPYPSVKAFLENIAIPNSTLFGFLTQWGEFLAGVNLVVLSLYLIFNPKAPAKFKLLMSLGFATGLLLNATFWLASGHTSASTAGLNLVMGAVNLIGLVFVLKESESK